MKMLVSLYGCCFPWGLWDSYIEDKITWLFMAGGDQTLLLSSFSTLSNLRKIRTVKPDITYFRGQSRVANPLLWEGVFSALHWPFQPLEILTKELFF